MTASQTQRSKQFQALRRRAKRLQPDLAAIAHFEATGVQGATAGAILDARRAIVAYCIEQKNGGRCSRFELVRAGFASIRTAHRRLDALLEVPGGHYREVDDEFIVENFCGAYWNPEMRRQLEARQERKARNARHREKKRLATCQETPRESAEIRRLIQSELGETGPLESVFCAAKAEHSPSDPPPDAGVGRKRPAAGEEAALTIEALPEAWEDCKALGAEGIRLYFERENAEYDAEWERKRREPVRKPEPVRAYSGRDAFRPELVAHLRPSEGDIAWAIETAGRFRGRPKNFGALVATALKGRLQRGWT